MSIGTSYVVGKIDSAIYITNVTGAGTITNKAYEASTSPANKILTEAESDNDDITVHFEVHAEGPPWQPLTATASGGGATPVASNNEDWSQTTANGARVFAGSVQLSDADTTGDIVVTLSDGTTATFGYTRGLSEPLILTAAWDGNYPAVQTQVKSGDTVTLTGTVETHATTIRVASFGATSSQQDFADDYSSGTFSISVTIGSGSGSKQFRLSATAGGGYGATLDTADSPAIDLNQTSPTFGAFSVNYNGSQEAAKGAETFDVTLAHTNAQAGDTYVYVDPTGTDVTIPSLTTYAATKTGCTIDTAGIYRDDDSTANFRLTVTRTTLNGKSASSSGTCEIADVAALIKIDDSSSTYASGGGVARMGTDDGTNNYRDRNLYVISNQKHLSTSTSSIAPDAGDSAAFTGAWTEDDDFTFRRNFRVEDGDIKSGGQGANTFNWITITTTNRAGTVTTSITKNPSYSLGGFETRTLNMGPITGGDPPYTHTGDIGVPVVDTSKCTVTNVSKGGAPAQAYEGSVVEHNDADSTLNNFWTTVNALGGESFDDFTKYLHCSDKKFYESVTAPGGYDLTIAEAV